MTGATSGTGTAYPYGAPEFTLVLVGFVQLDLWLYVYVLLIVVCLFVLFLLAIVLSVLLRYTDSDYLWNLHSVFSGVRVTRYLVLYVCFVDRCIFFLVLFPLAIVLSVL